MNKHFILGSLLKNILMASGILLILAILGGSIFFYHAHADSPSAPNQQVMPVEVVVVQETEAQVWTNYSGRLTAVDYVEVRPQVSGAIKDIKFDDGQEVKKGDVLLIIDPAPYESAVSQADAELATAKSQHDLAQKQLQRAEDLARTDAISKDLLDERQNAARVAKNAINSASARLKQAKIDLDYAYVKAPIAGRVGRSEITSGNLVQAGPNAPLLTTIVANKEIYADFDVDEQTYLQNISTAQGLEAERAIPVKLTVRGRETTVYEGTVHSFDNSINPATGTIRARALFQNTDGALLPGMFATIKLGNPDPAKKILISERAIGTDQDRKFIYVVGNDNKVQYREVKLGASVDDKRIVLQGLKDGEKVIVDGIMRIRPDMMVEPRIANGLEPPEALLPAMQPASQ